MFTLRDRFSVAASNCIVNYKINTKVKTTSCINNSYMLKRALIICTNNTYTYIENIKMWGLPIIIHMW